MTCTTTIANKRFGNMVADGNTINNFANPASGSGWINNDDGQYNITTCKHQQRFRLDVQFSALVHNFNNTFLNGHLYRAGQSMNFVPSQIFER